MGFYSEIENKVKEHGFAHVLFTTQVAWMATLGVTKKGFWIKTLLVILMSPIFIFLGYGEFADKIAMVGSATYDHPITNFIAANFLFLHWMAKVFPYLMVFYILTIFSTKMWSNYFWEKVEEVRE